ncbi:beta-galactosidase [Streptomyces triticirhizae]|uniref:Beta-galactosidase n=1 Tax=Streptomyces triticirhizae TaxID=2483353 RepID=A0A3M2M3A8_9ACTN|nr:beta-galactosidase [Streptomyces triticirhizae]RMI43590.1 beta-galactosidase [Streptomyces triticirhizae]
MPHATPRGLGRLAFGGDYNPEQWPEEVWREDIALMRQAGVNLVSLGIFSWARLEPRPGAFDFGWLDRVIELLHAAEIRIDLATPTVVPPAWFYREHPEALPVSRDGTRWAFGSRGAICHSSPAYREAITGIVTALGERYGRHPALAMWHVHNEYGVPVLECYCDVSAAHFRRWLAERYGSLDALNEAWGTAFWGQGYGDWEEIQPPRLTPTVANPAQRLDFARFASDSALANFRHERELLRELSPGTPVTTNFMVSPTQCDSMDYWAWGREVDLVTNDHYLVAEEDRNHINLAMAADLSRSVGGGRPWLLLEHSTSGVNWQRRGIAKRPGEMARNSLAHVARGSEGALFFQWRASRAGAEKFHSAMVPHAGTDSRIWREVVQLGSDLGRLAEIRGSETVADAAVVWDWQSWWAQKLEWRPSEDLDTRERAEAFYAALYDRHLTVDFVPPEDGALDGGALDRYPLVVVPALYLASARAGERLRRYVEGGGTLLVSYFSGIVDEHDAVHPGPHPGALRGVLGLTVEEFQPLHAGRAVRLTGSEGVPDLSADTWAETVVTRGAEPVWRYADGPAAGGPAVTRHRLGEGTAWYVSARLGRDDLDAVLALALADARLPDRDELPRDLEVVRRRGGSGAVYLFAINHNDAEVTMPLPGAGVELLTGADVAGKLGVPGGGVRVVRLAG